MAGNVNVCVLRIEGTNCEDEMANAFRLVGANADIVHLKQLKDGDGMHPKVSLESYDVLAFPGGFSAGDYIRAGAMFAARLKSIAGKDIKDFVEDGKPVLGVCNGFQILVELGLLPSLGTAMTAKPTAALYRNDSGRFECRPTLLRNDNKGSCAFTRCIKEGEVLMFPSAHAEGKLMGLDGKTMESLEDNDQIVFRYVGEDGGKAEYPWNPNGSPSDIAGICNSQGNVMGLMPHPERAMSGFSRPDWTRSNAKEKGDGFAIFESVMKGLVN